MFSDIMMISGEKASDNFISGNQFIAIWNLWTEIVSLRGNVIG